MIDSYRTIAVPARAKITRKKSRFIGLLYPVSSIDEINEVLERIKRQYHDATHHCYAYRLLGKEGVISRADDAGEPAGSAGPPILQALEGAELYDVLAVVVRYFGGVKLGIGGLIRAYGDAVKEVLAQADIILRVHEIGLEVNFPPQMSGQVMAVLHRCGAKIEKMSYDDLGRVRVRLRSSMVGQFTSQLRDATGARGKIREME